MVRQACSGATRADDGPCRTTERRRCGGGAEPGTGGGHEQGVDTLFARFREVVAQTNPSVAIEF